MHIEGGQFLGLDMEIFDVNVKVRTILRLSIGCIGRAVHLDLVALRAGGMGSDDRTDVISLGIKG